MQQRGAQFDRVKIQSTVVPSAAHDSHRISPDGIVYTSANVKIKNSQFNLDLNNDGTTDFVIAEANLMYQTGCGGRGGPFTASTESFRWRPMVPTASWLTTAPLQNLSAAR
jgi:hypothetical protein